MAAFFVSLNMSFRFPKSERLSAKKDIEMLFESGNSVRKGVLTLKWVLREKHPDETDRQVLIAVPKRNVKLAVDRNRIKRQLRELYRLNKDLYDSQVVPSNKTLLIGVIYLGRGEMQYELLKTEYQGLVSKFNTGLKTR
jgi:ribonuclease P protein component